MAEKQTLFVTKLTSQKKLISTKTTQLGYPVNLEKGGVSNYIIKNYRLLFVFENYYAHCPFDFFLTKYCPFFN